MRLEYNSPMFKEKLTHDYATSPKYDLQWELAKLKHRWNPERKRAAAKIIRTIKRRGDQDVAAQLQRIESLLFEILSSSVHAHDMILHRTECELFRTKEGRKLTKEENRQDKMA